MFTATKQTEHDVDETVPKYNNDFLGQANIVPGSVELVEGNEGLL